MAALSIQTAVPAGIALSFASAASGGDTMVNDGKTVLIVKNASGSAITVTVTAKAACPLGSLHNISVSVANGAEQIIGPFLPAIYNNTSGAVEITYSSVTSVTVAALKVSS
jgi:hypothetical protein